MRLLCARGAGAPGQSISPPLSLVDLRMQKGPMDFLAEFVAVPVYTTPCQHDPMYSPCRGFLTLPYCCLWCSSDLESTGHSLSAPAFLALQFVVPPKVVPTKACKTLQSTAWHVRAHGLTQWPVFCLVPRP